MFPFLALASTMLSSVGKLAGGFMNSSLDKLQSSIANDNTNFLTQQAAMQADEGKLSLDQGALQQSRTVAAVNRTLGAETGKFTASNLNPQTGSPLLLEGFSAGQGATDMALIGAKAELGNAEALQQSAGTLNRAVSSSGEASAFNMKSTSDILSGIFGAGTTMLSGLSDNGGAQWSALTQAATQIGQGMGGMASSFANMVVSG
jgi:hypothetical protein